MQVNNFVSLLFGTLSSHRCTMGFWESSVNFWKQC